MKLYNLRENQNQPKWMIAMLVKMKNCSTKDQKERKSKPMTKTLNLKKICMRAEDLSKENISSATFVGLRIKKEEDKDNKKLISIKPLLVFPRGYRFKAEIEGVSITEDEDDEEKLKESNNMYREDAMLLLRVLQQHYNENKDKKRFSDNSFMDGKENVKFPVQAYEYIIKDFLTRGYYLEREMIHRRNGGGKIDWKKTIQTVKPIFDNGRCVYLDFITRKSRATSNVITRIHEYCVYESFEKLGWLFVGPSFMPRKPELSILENKSYYVSILRNALKNTFNENKKGLFSNMLSILECQSDSDGKRETVYGINQFEHVWEWMIEKKYGVEKNLKKKCYPYAEYHFIDSTRKGEKPITPSKIEPDTIMVVPARDDSGENSIFVFDAKYYRYGVRNKGTNDTETDNKEEDAVEKKSKRKKSLRHREKKQKRCCFHKQAM